MEKITFIRSWMEFWLKGEITFEKNFLKVVYPNTIFFGLIPMGNQKYNIPTNQISSVNSNFSLNLKELIGGIIVGLIGVDLITNRIFLGWLVSFLAVAIINDAFRLFLIISETSGHNTRIKIDLFEKPKLQLIEDAVNKIIADRMNDTNNRIQTDRVVEAIKDNN